MKRIFHKSFSGGAVAIVNATPFPRFSSNRRYQKTNDFFVPVSLFLLLFLFLFVSVSDNDENSCENKFNEFCKLAIDSMAPFNAYLGASSDEEVLG
jgi:hypothetical protein